MRRLAFFLPLCVCVAACGGSSGLTEAQYAAKVSRLCEVAADQVRELHMDNSTAAWKADGAQMLRIGRRFKKALAALEPPADMKQAAARYAKANGRALRDEVVVYAFVRGRLKNDLTSLRALTDQTNVDYLKTFGPAKAIGATGCYSG